MSKILPLTFMALISHSALATISVDQYLDTVKKQNLSFQSSETQIEGASLQKREADLFFTPQFFFNAQSGYDSKLLSPPFLVYDQVKSDRISAGVSQEFEFGLQARFSYDLNKTEYKGLDLGDKPNPYWDAIPTLELSIPLWGNALGRTSKARRELTLQQRTFEQYSASAQGKRTLVEAEIAYWRLSAAQESVEVQNKALKAAREILDYVIVKKRKNLGEEADVLQAQALTEAYRLQLEQAQIEERTARRKFNLFLNVDADAPVAKLTRLDYKKLAQITVPEARPGDRPDVKASKAQVALARASSQLATEQNKPTLDLYGGYSLFGRDGRRSEAISNAGHPDRDSGYVGVRFNMPLNVSAQSDARKGAGQVERAAEMNYRYLTYAQEQDWTDLTSLVKDAQTSLKLAQSMERAQKAKLDNERVRLRQGRTTTYQVLLFEQDYLSAEIARIRAASQIINLNSQIQLYSVSEEGK